MKMNSIVDAKLIDELYAASAAGARIDLVVRGICCLRPGVPGLSEGITVRSIVGRYLEHSRICRFGEPGDPGTEYVIGSADLMPRNLDRRVEAMLRVTEPNLRARLDEILELNLADDVLAWTLEPDGTWRKVPTVVGLESHVRFQELAVARAKAPAPTAMQPARDMIELDDTATVADVIKLALRSSVDRLYAHEAAVRRGEDPEDVHQARVAARRMRSDLRTFRDFVDAEWANELRAELQWVGERARRGARHRGHARTAARRRHGDARQRTRCSRSRRSPPRRRLARGPDAHDRAARRIPVRARCAPRSRPRPSARGARRGRICARLRRFPQVVRHPWRKLRDAVDDLGATPPDDALHAVRIRAKRARYAAEATIPVFGKPAQRFARAIADVQDVLGEHQDAVVARTWLAKTASECSPTEAFAAGMLAERETQAADAARAALPEVWDGRPRAASCGAGCESHGHRRSRRRDRAPRRAGRARGPRRPPAEVRRLEPAQGQARGRARPTRSPRSARSPRRPAGAAPSTRSCPPCATPTGTAARSTSVTGS